jgi:zinc and cadmium transporter
MSARRFPRSETSRAQPHDCGIGPTIDCECCVTSPSRILVIDARRLSTGLLMAGIACWLVVARPVDAAADRQPLWGFARNIADPDPSDRGHTHHDPSAEHGPASNASVWWLLAIYSPLIAAASLFGGWLPGHLRLSHVGFQLILSLIAGLILGIGVFHLLPHALRELDIGQVDRVAWWMMIGMLLMFFLLRTLHVHHQQGVLDDESVSAQHSASIEHPEHGEPRAATPVAAVSTAQSCGHDHHSHAHHDHSHGHLSGATNIGWLGVFVGLAIHTLLDGVALGATLQAESFHGAVWLSGLGMVLAIVLHKPLDSLAFTTLMASNGVPVATRWRFNAVYALLCPIGAGLFLLGATQLSGDIHTFVGCSLAFSAGIFICVALADLLPEMEFHAHHRVQLSLALLAGIALAWLMQFLEPSHFHQ